LVSIVYVVLPTCLLLCLINWKESDTVIGIDWVIVYDLVSIIGGIVMGVALMRPRSYSGRSDRRYDRRYDLN
jgi:hypothetical protein